MALPEEMKKAFEAFDTDKNGTVDYDEWQRALKGDMSIEDR